MLSSDRMTKEQALAISQFIIQMIETLAGMAPSLDEDVERLRDLDKSMIAGLYLAIRLLFSEDEASALRELVEKVYRAKHGEMPDLVPRVVADGPATGVFKKQIYGDLGWDEPPTKAQ